MAILSGLAAVALLLSACGQPQKNAFLQTYDAPSGDFRIRYLDPPWVLVEGDGATAVFRIPSNAATFVGIDSAIAPKYQLDVSVVRNDPLALARAEERSAGSRGEVVAVPPREVTTESEDGGWEVLTRQDSGEGRHFRFVYLAHPRGAVRLLFQGTPDLDDPEVDSMVAAAEVLPEGT